MRHRVATFFRTSPSPLVLHERDSGGIYKDSLHKTSVSKISTSPNHYINSCSSDEQSSKMHDSHKWISISCLHCPKSCSHKLPQVTSSLDVEMESPPLVFYGPTSTSSGALLSGQLVLRVICEAVVVKSLNMSLDSELTRKRPYHTHCIECGKLKTNLESWNFLQGPATFQKGEYKFPFSWILPGHLPASTKGSLFSIEYLLHANLAIKGSDAIMLSKNLEVKRAIIPSDIPRNSIRIFPPTNLTTYCGLPSVLHPFGTSTVSIRIEGCVKENLKSKTKHQWKLKRLNWHLDEMQKCFSPACTKHLAKRIPKDEENKKTVHTNVRVIGEDCYKMGWKTEAGRIEMEFPCTIRPGIFPICDMKAEDGTEVSHSLVVEMIIIEEFVSMTRAPTENVPVGAARVLRMHFNITVTEHSGLGISWDEEQPPIYENVPASPPEYGKLISCEQEPILGYENLLSIDAIRASNESNLSNQHLTSRSIGEQTKILS